jgi:hypothetical protein
MIRIERLIEALKKFPSDARAYAYEGEVTGIVVRSADNREQLGWIEATERREDESGEVRA